MSVTITGRGWAYIGAALGGTVSIAANIAHSYVPPAGVTVERWSPNIGAVIGAVFWPVGLFVATEILTRVAWPSGTTWQLLRWLGMLPVAFVAALVSYRHLSGLLAYYGDEPMVCILGPLAVDGLMVISSGALLATGTHQHTQSTTTQPAPTQPAPTQADTMSVPAVPDPVEVPALTPPAVPALSITAPTSAADDPQPSAEPAVTPEPTVDSRVDVPTPADVAARVTPSPTSIPLRPTATRPATPSTPRPKPRKPETTTTAERLAAPATDTPVTEPGCSI
ncbi:hypothetical protein AB0M20_34650, partial [Actinoplanes sp. NPDC051633]|uniref:hypothetical protein n=1 Tax=Actinoplanes sp. NPDC051633 TaxID=3155670 RepID=UPI003415CE17